MLSVIGGKLTTAGSLARECATRIGVRPAIPALALASLALSSEDGVDRLIDRLVTETAEAAGISEASARGIAEWHGKHAPAIAGMGLSSEEMRAPLCPHTGHIVAEAVNAFAKECAVTLADVLLRRVPVALGACWSQECSREAAMRIAPIVGWNQERTASELEAFEAEREAFLQKPARISTVVEARVD